MPDVGLHTTQNDGENGSSSYTTLSRSIFQLPPVVKRVFDRFPRTTYEANRLPQRALVDRHKHALHVFSTDSEAKRGRPSYNPACLKWQTYLKFCGLHFTVVPSNNHASPTGVLPFLQPAASDHSPLATGVPVPSNKLQKWLASQTNLPRLAEIADVRYEAYASLLDNRIRNAWLFQLYLSPQNAPLVYQLYLKPCSSHRLVQMAIGRQLRLAAEAELVKSAGSIIVSSVDLIRDAEEAMEALSVLLEDDEWFFGEQQPGLFDASVFAYTHLILNAGLGWNYNPLEEVLTKHPRLIQHRNRIAENHFG